MNKKLLTAAFIAAITIPAQADLIVPDYIEPYIGQNCYSESDDIKLYYITGPSFFLDDSFQSDMCPDRYEYFADGPDGECWVELFSHYAFVCAKTRADNSPKTSCRYTSAWEDLDWHSTGRNTNRVRKMEDSNVESVGDYRCTANPTYAYGCAAGYYQSGGSDESMTCEKCPSPGTSVIGNTEISGCYVPKGTHTDDTGTFTVSGDCHYK